MDAKKSRLVSKIIANIAGGFASVDPLENPPLLDAEYYRRLQSLAESRAIFLRDALTRLDRMGPDELADMYDVNGYPISDESKSWFSAARAQVEKLLRDIPEWHLAAFKIEGLTADYSYWAKSAYFDINELLWLSTGLEPSERMQNCLAKRKASPRSPSQTVEFLDRRRELFKRQFSPYRNVSHLTAAKVNQWINLIELEVHAGFRKMLEDMTSRTNKRNPSDGAELSEAPESKAKFENREKTSLAKLLTAIAIAEYGYDPAARRSPIPNEIRDIAAKLGLSISADTIRAYLQMGARHLPPGWNADSD